MRIAAHKFIFLLSILVISSSLLHAQGGGNDDAYTAEKRKAIELFGQDKYGEALPIFEGLAKKNPQDNVVLLGLGGCLVMHSATLEDRDAATKERLRARTLLLKAKELGNTNPLLENLLQTVPVDGVIKYSNKPADQAIRAGEQAFARRDFEEAIRNYSKALELEPKNYLAALYIGDSYFAAKDFARAGGGYERAIQLDPNRETAYRYYSDMLTKNGEMEKARTRAIQAVVAEPYNPITWRGLEAWAKVNHVELKRVHINVPNNVAKKDEKNTTISLDPNTPAETAPVWLAYSLAKALWLGDKFKKQFPSEKQYRHSLAEEADALTTAAKVWDETSQSKAKDKKSSSLPSDPSVLTLIRLHQAGMLEPYVLLNAADEGIAQDYEGYREKNRAKLEDYLSQFVVPPVPAPAQNH